MSQHVLSIRVRGQNDQDRFPSLPVSVINVRGEIISTGSLGASNTKQLRYPRGDAPLFARLTLPNGTTETRPLLSQDRSWRDEVVFTIETRLDSIDRIRWSAMRLDMTGGAAGALSEYPGMEAAWFQIWERSGSASRWYQMSVRSALSGVSRSREALQLDLHYSHNQRALVACFDGTTPQVVILPPGSHLSILLTLLRTLADVVTPRLVIGGYGPNTEAILEFLRTGTFNSLESMFDPGSELAHELLRDKTDDPLAATAAAYYLLRKRDWDRLPPSWLDNLANWHPWIPDAELIQTASKIERGMPLERAANLAARTLENVQGKGVPLFAEAGMLLSDHLALAEQATKRLDARVNRSVRRMLASFQPAGLSFGFKGKTPGTPLSDRPTFEERNELFFNTTAQKIIDLVEAQSESLSLNSDDTPGEQREQLHSSVKAVLHSVALPLLRPSGSTAKTLFLRDIFY